MNSSIRSRREAEAEQENCCNRTGYAATQH